MAGTKEIRVKIASIKSTQKITKALEMVAVSKMRKAQERMRAAQPYADKIRSVIGHLRVANPNHRHPYLVEREVKSVGMIVVSSDRGFAGALNVNIFKQVLNAARTYQEQGVDLHLCLIGAKALRYFKRLKLPVVASITHLGDTPHVAELIGTVRAMLDLYEQGKIDRLFLVSNRFINSMVQKPTMLQLLPAETVDAADLQERWDYIYEPGAGCADLELHDALHRIAGLSRRDREPRERNGRAHGRHEERDRQRRQDHRRTPDHLQQGPPGRDHEGNFGDRRRRGSGLVPRFY